jgi:hypothetical protein
MKFQRILLLLALPAAIAACDSSQPTYSASNPNPNSNPPAAPAAAPPAQPSATAAPASTPQAAEPQPMATRVAAGSRDEIMRKPVAQGIHLPPSETVGIGGCDDYVARYRACLTDESGGVVAPMPRKYQLAHALARQVRKWNMDVKSGKTGEVAQACTQASDEARETLGKLGCKTI